MFAFLRIERPTKATFRPQSSPTSAACCIRGTFEGEEQVADAGAADLRQAAAVGALPVDRRVVELVVAGVDATAARRLEHDRGRVGNRVRHPDELEAERADLDRLVSRREL